MKIALPTALMLTVALVSVASAGNPGQYNVPANKRVLQGYDVVSYFQKGPVKGDPYIWAVHEGLYYYFGNEDNKKAFVAEPGKYMPAYGGWCATAMAAGDKVEIDPTNYKVTNGRLFLFYKGWLGNAINDWNKNEANLINKADAAWKKISGE